MALIYTSGSIPLFQNDEVNELARYVEEELSRLEQVLRNYETESMRFSILNNAINKPRNGDVIYADGTKYWYVNNKLIKLEKA